MEALHWPVSASMTEVTLFSTHDFSGNRIDLLEHVPSVLALAPTTMNESLRTAPSSVIIAPAVWLLAEQTKQPQCVRCVQASGVHSDKVQLHVWHDSLHGKLLIIMPWLMDIVMQLVFIFGHVI